MNTLDQLTNYLNDIFINPSLSKIVVEYMTQQEDKSFVHIPAWTRCVDTYTMKRYFNINAAESIGLSIRNNGQILLILLYANDRDITITDTKIIREILEKLNNKQLTEDFEKMIKKSIK